MTKKPKKVNDQKSNDYFNVSVDNSRIFPDHFLDKSKTCLGHFWGLLGKRPVDVYAHIEVVVTLSVVNFLFFWS